MRDNKITQPLDETVDAEPSGGNLPQGSQRMTILADRTPQLTMDTDDLLRSRLRSASLVMFASYLAFFVRSLFNLDRFVTSLDRTLLIDHGLMTLFTGLLGYRLCTGCEVTRRHLRSVELIVFGGSVVFFMFYGYSILTRYATSGYLVPITPVWLMLIFTYALFIPNPLRRAALVIGTIAAAPILLMLFVYYTSSDVRSVIQTNSDFHGYITEGVLVMSLSAASAIWGAHTIGNLRREAFRAKQLGQYRLKQTLGAGGMGEVYLAEHLLLKRPCAIKLIRPDKAGDARALARFEREVRATAKLTHPNTIDIYDYGQAEDGTFYYVMEYLPGLSIAELIQLDGPAPAGRVIHLLAQACDALREAHEQGLVHRDIKPANLFAAQRGGLFDVAKLLDFGLVRPAADLSNGALTTEGTITGSPMYISPEQVTGDVVDARSDIYSLGAVAYHFLTGVPPFQHDQPMKIMLAHARDEASPLTLHEPSIPADLERIVLRCLEKDPSHRYQTAGEMRSALLQCQAAASWTRELAAQWWQHKGCPKKKDLDATVWEAVGV